METAPILASGKSILWPQTPKPNQTSGALVGWGTYETVREGGLKKSGRRRKGRSKETVGHAACVEFGKRRRGQ